MDYLNIYIRIVGFIYGKSMYIIRDVDIMKKIMKTSTIKGETGLEQLLSKKNWLPVLSVESEDGENWKRLREYFNKVYNNLQWKEKLPLIIEDICSKYKNCKVINSHIISGCVGEIMLKLLFNYTCNQNEINLLINMRDEFAKTLSLNGSPNNNLRFKSFEFIKKLVLSSNNTNTDIINLNEWVSIYIQPFIISPMINISDLFASLPKFLQETNISIHSDKLLVELLDYQHPFPLLERISIHSFNNIKKGDHVFFAVDDNEKLLRKEKSGIRFGNGSRGCPGQNLAIMLFQGMVKELYNNDENIFCPSVNHYYSGRTNDNYSFYKIKSLLKLLFVEPNFLNKYVLISSLLIYISLICLVNYY